MTQKILNYSLYEGKCSGRKHMEHPVNMKRGISAKFLKKIWLPWLNVRHHTQWPEARKGDNDPTYIQI